MGISDDPDDADDPQADRSVCTLASVFGADGGDDGGDCDFAADFALSFKAALDLRDVLVRMEQAKDELEKMQRRLDVILAVSEENWENRKKSGTRVSRAPGLALYSAGMSW